MIFDEWGRGRIRNGTSKVFSFFKILFTPKNRLFFLNNHFISPIQQKYFPLRWPFMTSGENNWFSKRGRGEWFFKKIYPPAKEFKGSAWKLLKLVGRPWGTISSIIFLMLFSIEIFCGPGANIWLACAILLLIGL